MIVGAFGLRKDPFRITPDPQFFFAGAQMRSALEELASALLGRRGLVLVLGDSGTGKTTLLRKMEADLEAAGSIAIIVTQPRTGIDDILHRWTEKLGVEAEPGDRAGMVSAIRARRRAGGRDALAVMLIDEADHCAEPLLRDLVALGAPAVKGSDGLQTVLAGQMVLEARLGLELPDLYRQVATVTHLERLSPSDVGAYIRHRLELAGYSGPGLFGDQLVDRIAELTGGVPRLINHLCGRALSLASQAGESVVAAATLDEAASDCMLLEGPTRPTKPTQPVAAPQAAPRRPVLVEKLAAQRSAATPPAASEPEIPTPGTAEASTPSRAEAKPETVMNRGGSERSTTVSAAPPEGGSLAPASVEIPEPPAVSREPATRVARSPPADRAQAAAQRTERDEEPSLEIPIVTLVAAPAEATDTSAVIPDETVPIGGDEAAIALSLGAETETVLEPPRRATARDDNAALVTPPSPERDAAEMPAAAAKTAVGMPSQVFARAAADVPPPDASERYVPISRAAVSKLVGRRRPRLPSEANDVASSAPAPEPPRAPPSPANPALPATKQAAAEPASFAVSGEIEMRRRRSVIESADDRREPVVARSSGWLRRVALFAVLVAGVAAGTYTYFVWFTEPPQPPRAVTDTVAPAPPSTTPPVAAARDQPAQGAGETPSPSVVGDDRPRPPIDLPAARTEEEVSSERPALPVPRILRLPVIDPRRSSGAGAISAPGDVLQSEPWPGRSSMVDAELPSTVAALGTPQSTIRAGSNDGVVMADPVAPPIATLQIPPAPIAHGDRPSIAVAASSPVADAAPTPAAVAAPTPLAAPVVPAATATPPAATSIALDFERWTQAQELSRAPETTQADLAPAAISTMSEAAQDAIAPPTPPSPPPVAPVQAVTSDPLQAVVSAAPTTPSTPAGSRADARTTEPAPVRATPRLSNETIDASPAIDRPAMTSPEPRKERLDDRSPGAVAERPLQQPTGSVAAVPGEIAPGRPTEPTRAAAVAVAPSPSAGSIRLTQGGGGVGAEQLIARGDIYLRDGDIASARLLFEAAVRLGNAAAARRIGTTYDPIEHRRLRIVGVSPNAQVALDWYRQAIEAGDAEARRRHAELSAWIARGGAR